MTSNPKSDRQFQHDKRPSLENLSAFPPQEGGTTLEPIPKSDPARAKKGRDERPHSYYDIPMLKASVWSNDIPLYFYLGGMSAGAYLIARMAARFGGEKFNDVTQVGTAVSMAAFLPCPPLLIHDLGDPRRFIYMLRVFKPRSPMNLGSWILTGFGGVLSLASANQWRKWRREKHHNGSETGALKAANRTVEALADAAGVPLALGLAGYTGVLLSSTSTPLWARNRWIGPLFSASAVSAGAAAINLALERTHANAEAEPSHRPMLRITQAAHVAEAVTLAGFLAEAGNLAEPVTQGKYAPALWIHAVGTGLALSSALDMLPVKSPKTRRALRIAGAVAGLAGGLALRWAITNGGIASGKSPQAARDASKPR